MLKHKIYSDKFVEYMYFFYCFGLFARISCSNMNMLCMENQSDVATSVFVDCIGKNVQNNRKTIAIYLIGIVVVTVARKLIEESSGRTRNRKNKNNNDCRLKNSFNCVNE